MKIQQEKVPKKKVLNHVDNTEVLTPTFINELLATLLMPGYTVVMDHVQTEAVKLALKNAGHILQFLPVNSSNFNPVEYLFSQWEKFIAAMSCSSLEGLIELIRTVTDA
eukprot:gene4952-5312_t